VVPGTPHVFQAFAALLDEGRAALTRAGGFLRQHLTKTAAETAGRQVERRTGAARAAR
jgi:monoterpene epsilon-lactone hydrolase